MFCLEPNVKGIGYSLGVKKLRFGADSNKGGKTTNEIVRFYDCCFVSVFSVFFSVCRGCFKYRGHGLDDRCYGVGYGDDPGLWPCFTAACQGIRTC